MSICLCSHGIGGQHGKPETKGDEDGARTESTKKRGCIYCDTVDYRL